MVGRSVHRKWKDVTGWVQRAGPSFSLCFPAGRARMLWHRWSLLVSWCIASLCCVSVWASAYLSEEQGKISKGFYPKPATPVAFPFPSRKEKAAIQQLARQMTAELSHPVIWESLPRFVPPRDSQRSQHAPICHSRTSCQLPPCQWAAVKVPHLCLQGWTVWFPPMQFFIAAVWVRDVVFLPFSSSHQSCSAQTNVC